VQQLKQESGKGLVVGGVQVRQALAERGLIDEYEFVLQPRLMDGGADIVRGSPEAYRRDAREPSEIRARAVPCGMSRDGGHPA
jgi:dihydrofolate reductase